MQAVPENRKENRRTKYATDSQERRTIETAKVDSAFRPDFPELLGTGWSKLHEPEKEERRITKPSAILYCVDCYEKIEIHRDTSNIDEVIEFFFEHKSHRMLKGEEKKNAY